MKYIILTMMVLAVSLLFISNSYGINEDTQMILREIDGINRGIRDLSAKNDTTNMRMDTLVRQIVDMQAVLVAEDTKHEIEINNIKASQKYGGVLWGILGGAGGTGVLGGTGLMIVKKRNGRNSKSSTN